MGQPADVNLLFDKLERFGGVHGRRTETRTIFAPTRSSAFDLDFSTVASITSVVRVLVIDWTGDGAPRQRHIPNVNTCRFSPLESSPGYV